MHRLLRGLMKLEKWTRRDFVRGAAGVLVLPHLPQPAITFAYVASSQNTIQAFRVRGKQRTPIQEIASVAPACIVRARNTLYVANDVAMYDRLPRGSIESFRIGTDGHLTPLARTALSLSAGHPRSMAISPDARLLAVAAYEGGIYNLFTIAADGRLGTPSSIFKDTNCAHPDRLTFDSNGKHLIASDLRSQRQSVLAFDGDRLTRA